MNFDTFMLYMLVGAILECLEQHEISKENAIEAMDDVARLIVYNKVSVSTEDAFELLLYIVQKREAIA